MLLYADVIHSYVRLYRYIHLFISICLSLPQILGTRIFGIHKATAFHLIFPTSEICFNAIKVLHFFFSIWFIKHLSSRKKKKKNNYWKFLVTKLVGYGWGGGGGFCCWPYPYFHFQLLHFIIAILLLHLLHCYIFY